MYSRNLDDTKKDTNQHNCMPKRKVKTFDDFRIICKYTSGNFDTREEILKI